jgi:hypothetical protein
MSELTGYSELPSPPPPLHLIGPDGRGHTLSFRVYRGLVGVQVELEERLGDTEVGYRFEALGNHDADVDELLAHVDGMAKREVRRCYLEPSRHRSGWTVGEEIMEVAGRFYSDDAYGTGEPHGVVIDGRALSWEEFGRALDSFVGWRFRLIIDDRMDDLRPDAEVVAFPSKQPPPKRPVDSSVQSASTKRSGPTKSAGEQGSSTGKGQKVTATRRGRKVGPVVPNIESVLSEFLCDQEKRLSERTYRNYLEVVELFKHSLNGYGYQALDKEERALFDEAYGGDDEAFVHQFGPDKIVENLGEFLSYFMVRKVIAGQELLRAAGTVTKKLVKWLGERGYVEAEDVAEGASAEPTLSVIFRQPTSLPSSSLRHHSGRTLTWNRWTTTTGWRTT